MPPISKEFEIKIDLQTSPALGGSSPPSSKNLFLSKKPILIFRNHLIHGCEENQQLKVYLVRKINRIIDYTFYVEASKIQNGLTQKTHFLQNLFYFYFIKNHFCFSLKWYFLSNTE